MIGILTKIHAKITIIVVENRESYYFIIFCKCKEVPLSLFSYQIWLQLLTTDKQSSYYKVHGGSQDLSVEFGALLCTVYEGKRELVVTKFVFPTNHAPSYFLHIQHSPAFFPFSHLCSNEY